MKKLGFIGLGIMGRPMAENLLKAGFPLTVYNRSRSAIDRSVRLGATAANSPKEVAENSDVVIIMVTDSPDVEQVILEKDGVIYGARSGSIVIDMSTISPDTTKRIARELAKKGIVMLDAPVSGGDKGAKEGTLTIMVGGQRSAYEECMPIFQALGKKMVYMGESGSGQLTKLANQILVANNMMAVCECLTFAKKAGLNLMNLIDSLSAGAASSWSLVNLGPKAIKSDFSPGFKIKLLQKDLRHVLSIAEELNAPLPAVALVHRLYDSLEAEGYGEEGTQALIRVFEEIVRNAKNK
jgi:3-hydroxyisobutyrate dehydrogenase